MPNVANVPSRNYVFTVQNPVAPLDFAGKPIKYAVWQLERAPTTGTYHFQGYVELERPMRIAGVRKLFPAGVHFESRRGTADEAREYCRKEETRVVGAEHEFAGMFEFGDWGVRGAGSRTDFAAFIEAVEVNPRLDIIKEYPEMVARYGRFAESALKRAKKMHAAPDPVLFVPNCVWQNHLVSLLGNEPDKRKVHWFVDLVGGSGKSYFGRHYLDSAGLAPYVVTGGKHADIYYAYDYQPVIIFDWSRAHEDNFPYGVVESFKNGYFLSTKYESVAVKFKTPHVVVFSNFQPDQSKLSMDRWDIVSIITV